MQIQLPGKTIEYEMQGSGNPLVLIHGYPLNSMMWEAQFSLADAAMVIAPNLQGFGGTPTGDEEMRMGVYADDLDELLKALNIRQPVVIGGFSMGGYVAFEFLRRYPHRVGALILANTKMTPDSMTAKEARDNSAALARQGGAAAIAQAMLPKMFSPKTYASKPALVAKVQKIMESATVPGLVGALMAMKERPDSRMTMGSYEGKSLIITGADDNLIPVSESELMKEASTDGTLVILPDAGHLSNMEQPDAFNKAIRTFLAGLEY